MKDKTRKIISVDIDNFVAVPLEEKDRHNYILNVPIRGMIEKINKLYEDRHVIIYYTGRAPKYYEQTYAWLIASGCKFHALRMGKLHADWHLDDRNANIEDIL